MIMEITAYNSAKGRLMTVRVQYTSENTTWFEEVPGTEWIYSITDTNGGLLIREPEYRTPLLVRELSWSSINHDQHNARKLIMQYL